MRNSITILLLFFSGSLFSQNYFDPDWIMVGKSHQQFKTFTRANDLKNPRLVGGKAEGDTTYRYTFQDNTFSKYIEGNKYKYISRSVTWLFRNDTVTHQIHNDLTSAVLADLKSLYGDPAVSVTTINDQEFDTHTWSTKDSRITLYSRAIYYYVTVSGSKNTTGQSLVEKLASKGIR